MKGSSLQGLSWSTASVEVHAPDAEPESLGVLRVVVGPARDGWEARALASSGEVTRRMRVLSSHVAKGHGFIMGPGGVEWHVQNFSRGCTSCG